MVLHSSTAPIQPAQNTSRANIVLATSFRIVRPARAIAGSYLEGHSRVRVRAADGIPLCPKRCLERILRCRLGRWRVELQPRLTVYEVNRGQVGRFCLH